MKCQECQRLILIQDLLEASDRVLMNQHITTCAACQKFQAESIRVGQLIGQTSAKVAQPANATGLTDKIMTAVMTPAPRKNSQQETWMFNPFTRLALSGLSLCLVILFLIEWQSPATAELPKGPVAGLQQVILNSQSFRKELSSKEKRKSLLGSCISPDKKQANITCLKEKMKSIQF